MHRGGNEHVDYHDHHIMMLIPAELANDRSMFKRNAQLMIVWEIKPDFAKGNLDAFVVYGTPSNSFPALRVHSVDSTLPPSMIRAYFDLKSASWVKRHDDLPADFEATMMADYRRFRPQTTIHRLMPMWPTESILEFTTRQLLMAKPRLPSVIDVTYHKIAVTGPYLVFPHECLLPSEDATRKHLGAEWRISHASLEIAAKYEPVVIVREPATTRKVVPKLSHGATPSGGGGHAPPDAGLSMRQATTLDEYIADRSQVLATMPTSVGARRWGPRGDDHSVESRGTQDIRTLKSQDFDGYKHPWRQWQANERKYRGESAPVESSRSSLKSGPRHYVPSDGDGSSGGGSSAAGPVRRVTMAAPVLAEQLLDAKPRPASIAGERWTAQEWRDWTWSREHYWESGSWKSGDERASAAAQPWESSEGWQDWQSAMPHPAMVWAKHGAHDAADEFVAAAARSARHRFQEWLDNQKPGAADADRAAEAAEDSAEGVGHDPSSKEVPTPDADYGGDSDEPPLGSEEPASEPQISPASEVVEDPAETTIADIAISSDDQIAALRLRLSVAEAVEHDDLEPPPMESTTKRKRGARFDQGRRDRDTPIQKRIESCESGLDADRARLAVLIEKLDEAKNRMDREADAVESGRFDSGMLNFMIAEHMDASKQVDEKHHRILQSEQRLEAYRAEALAEGSADAHRHESSLPEEGSDSDSTDENAGAATFAPVSLPMSTPIYRPRVRSTDTTTRVGQIIQAAGYARDVPGPLQPGASHRGVGSVDTDRLHAMQATWGSAHGQSSDSALMTPMPSAPPAPYSWLRRTDPVSGFIDVDAPPIVVVDDTNVDAAPVDDASPPTGAGGHAAPKARPGSSARTRSASQRLGAVLCGGTTLLAQPKTTDGALQVNASTAGPGWFEMLNISPLVFSIAFALIVIAFTAGYFLGRRKRPTSAMTADFHDLRNCLEEFKYQARKSMSDIRNLAEHSVIEVRNARIFRALPPVIDAGAAEDLIGPGMRHRSPGGVAGRNRESNNCDLYMLKTGPCAQRNEGKVHFFRDCHSLRGSNPDNFVYYDKCRYCENKRMLLSSQGRSSSFVLPVNLREPPAPYYDQ